MSGIIDVSKKIEEKLLLDRNLEQQVFFEISKIVSEAYQHSMAQSGKGYCYKFNLPFNAVTKKLYKLLDLTNEEVFKAFKKDWGQGAMKNRMHKDPYYQILLLLIYYGIKNNKKVITENAFFILLMKLWNGRKEKFIRYCDEKTMNYVVANMSKKFVITKYDGPLFLLKDYFVPTLLKKYSQQIKTDPAGRLGLRRLFEQSWSRIRQIFVFNKQRNLASGKDEYTGGIAPLYYQAKREGAKLDTTSIGKNEDSEQIDLMSVNEREDIARSIHAQEGFLGLRQRTPRENSIHRFEQMGSGLGVRPGGIANAQASLQRQLDRSAMLAEIRSNRQRMAEIDIEIFSIEEQLRMARQACPCIYSTNMF